MQKLNTLWQFVNAASSVRDMTHHTKTYYFGVTGAITFYLQTENADVRIKRWTRPQIEVTVKLQASFGWRIAAEQDDAGVYIAAKRRMMVGGLSTARFDIIVPYNIYLTLKLTESSLSFENLDGTLNIPPVHHGQEISLIPQK
jgi:hypothetical protein